MEESMTQQNTVQLEQSWKQKLLPEFDQPYMQDLKAFLLGEKTKGKRVYPKGPDIFNALNHTPFDKVKVVILGQDPYHGPNQAHGLCFSVQKGVPIPPSLRNIYLELKGDVGFVPPQHGCLTDWADRGVLLLNSILTVEAGQPGSHQGKGWETFTDQVIMHLNKEGEHVVFMLWGAYAKKKGAMIDRSRHLVLEAPHPSPFSAHSGFLECNHFTKANAYLTEHKKCPIDCSFS